MNERRVMDSWFSPQPEEELVLSQHSTTSFQVSFRLTEREEERSWERINQTNPVHVGSDVKTFHQSCPPWHGLVTSQHPERGSLSGAVNSQKTKTLTHGDTQAQTIHCNQWPTA